jgi:hypothetical protein
MKARIVRRGGEYYAQVKGWVFWQTLGRWSHHLGGSDFIKEPYPTVAAAYAAIQEYARKQQTAHIARRQEVIDQFEIH